MFGYWRRDNFGSGNGEKEMNEFTCMWCGLKFSKSEEFNGHLKICNAKKLTKIRIDRDNVRRQKENLSKVIRSYK